MHRARCRFSPVAVALLIPTLSACAAGDAGAPDWAGTRDTIAGVEVVRNPAAPLLDDDAVVATALWATDGGSDADDAPEWEQPSSVRAVGGAVYVLDRMAGRIYRYAATDGAFLAAIGRKGGGPGEVAQPLGFAVRAGEVIMADGASEMEVFDTVGAHLRSIRPDGLVLDIDPFGPDRLLLHLFPVGNTSRWAIVGPDGERRPLDPPAWTAGAPQDVPDCILDATSGPMIARAHCAMLRIQFIRDDGTVDGEIIVDRAPEYSTEAELDAYAARLRRDLGGLNARPEEIERATRDLRERMRVKQIFGGVRHDSRTGHSWVWEQRSEEFGGGAATLHLFDESGVYLARVAFQRPWYSFDVAGDRIYALERDPETDLATLVAYRVSVPSIKVRETH